MKEVRVAVIDQDKKRIVQIHNKNYKEDFIIKEQLQADYIKKYRVMLDGVEDIIP